MGWARGGDANLSILVLEESLDILQLLFSAEASGAELNNGAQHSQSRRETLVDSVPVGLDPIPAGVDAGWVVTETAEGHVNVLALDLVSRGEIEGAFDEGWVLGCSEAAEGSGLFIRGGSVEEAIQDDVVFLLGAMFQDDGEDTAADVRVDGGEVASGKAVEHVASGLDDGRVLGHTGAAE